MYRRFCASVIAVTAALFAVQVPESAKASTLTYNLALNPLLGPEGGTGSFTIIAPPVGSSGILTQGNGLTAMDFKIDGLDFSLSNSNSSEVSYSYQGSILVLTSLAYNGKIGSDILFAISLGGFGGYSFTDDGNQTIGSVSISATPIPTTLPLLATGLGGLVLLGLWRKRKVGTVLATHFGWGRPLGACRLLLGDSQT
jgi:hypothetical protein